MTFVIPATLAGASLALTRADGALDLRVLAVVLANNLTVAYAFMVNDIEDAPDDARDPARAARNPITCGEVAPGVAWLSALAVAAVALLCYALSGPLAFAVGALGVALSHFYSWKPVRLKAWPVLDVISHALMLSALLVLVGYVTYHANPGPAWLVIAGAFFGSAYGQLYNQVRDFEMDKAAGLHNTAIVAGARAARVLMYAMLVGALICGALALLSGLVPLWLIVVGAVALPLTLLLFRPKGDMRGGKAADVSGKVQVQVNVYLTAMSILWLIGVALGWG
ncbi:MAG: UbiA family prenyltransferase [Anaerolineae bacterium]|nr:UbiA family prenyltransferase [Anaerolineae bacterium]